MPHLPLREEERWVKPYEATIANKDRRLYAAAVTHMDDAVGRVLDALDACGVRERTVVVFLSDNGGARELPADAYGGYYGGYERLGDNRPLRGWKSQLYEGGIRVPAFVHWKGTFRPRREEGVVSVLDLFPTLARLAAAPLPKGTALDGKDVGPLLEGREKAEPRTLFWITSGPTAVRSGDWKLVEGAGGKVELFDVRADPTERTDRASENPRMVEDLRRRFVEWKTRRSK
jgi:arylsulfatase A-like enzyme